MNEVAERASAIRHYLREYADQTTVKRFSVIAARWEQLRLAQVEGKTTPGDDATLRELTSLLHVATHKLSLCTARNGFLPGDPQAIISNSWLDCARLWFG